MSHDKDYDRQIAELRQRMAELEQLKSMHVKKLEGVKEFEKVVARFVSEYGLTESELFVARADAIVAWITGAAKAGSEPPKYWRQLRDYFAGVLAAEGKAQAKPAKGGRRGRGGRAGGDADGTLVEAPLATGVYRNPFTREKVEKKRRNPKQLDNWIEEFGLGEVRTWRER